VVPNLHTLAPAHTPPAIEEWQTGIEMFLEWASKARTGDPSPEAVSADQALTAFSDGHFHGALSGVAEWAVLACGNILYLVRDAHWHLQPCSSCNRWFLAKDKRRGGRPFCRRVECVRRKKAEQKQSERRVHLR
jgi:hypothetical protein